MAIGRSPDIVMVSLNASHLRLENYRNIDYHGLAVVEMTYFTHHSNGRLVISLGYTMFNKVEHILII